MTTNVTNFILALGEVLVGRDQAEIAKARHRAMRILPVIGGFVIGCALGAACEAAVGLWSLILPTALALFAFGAPQYPRVIRGALAACSLLARKGADAIGFRTTTSQSTGRQGRVTRKGQ